MKITWQRAQEYVTHHEVGKVYRGRYNELWLLVKDFQGRFHFVDLGGFMVGNAYESLESVDKRNSRDVLVSFELVIKE